MTYCCGILVREGLVIFADTRTNAGVDNIATYRDAGASGYGIGSALYKPGRPAAEIGRLARALVAAAKA